MLPWMKHRYVIECMIDQKGRTVLCKRGAG